MKEEADNSLTRRNFLSALGAGLAAFNMPKIAFGSKPVSEGIKYINHNGELALRVKARLGESYELISLLYTSTEKNSMEIKIFNNNKFLHPNDLVFIQARLLRHSLTKALDENKFSIFKIAGQGDEGINTLWELAEEFMNNSLDINEKIALLIILNPRIRYTNFKKIIVYYGQEILVPDSLIDLKLENRPLHEIPFSPPVISRGKRQNPFKTSIESIKNNFIPEDLYGSKRIRGSREYYRISKHTGIDLAAKIGTPLYPIEDGILVKKGRDLKLWRNGIVVEYRTNSGLAVKYIHLSWINNKIKEGKPITTNTVLGNVGITGNANKFHPHVHIQIKIAGKTVDPYSYVVL